MKKSLMQTVFEKAQMDMFSSKKQRAATKRGQSDMFGGDKPKPKSLTMRRAKWQDSGHSIPGMPGESKPKKKAAAAGPFIGKRGGKWADAKHTIPWKEGGKTKSSYDHHKMNAGARTKVAHTKSGKANASKMEKFLAHEEAATAHTVAAKHARIKGDDASHEAHIQQADAHLTHSDFAPHEDNLTVQEHETAFHHYAEQIKASHDPARPTKEGHGTAAMHAGSAADHAIQASTKSALRPGLHHNKRKRGAESSRHRANATRMQDVGFFHSIAESRLQLEEEKEKRKNNRKS